MTEPRSSRALLALLLLPALAAACADDPGPVSPALERTVFGLLGGLERGEVMQLAGPDARTLHLRGGPEGADYLLVPFFASEGGQARLQVEIAGENLRARPALAAAALAPGGALDAGGRRPDWERHERLRQASRRELGPLLARPGARVRPSLARDAGAAAALEVGALLPLRVSAGCSEWEVRHGRVEAVSRFGIMVADTANPPGGFARADYEAFAEEFDALIHPVVTAAFGEPTDVDGNQRSVVFFSSAVNELSEPGTGSYVAGYFWAGDLLPRFVCPASNEAEIFYQLVPDPQGRTGGIPFDLPFVRRSTPGVIGHEYQHLINAGRRIYVNDAEDFEEVWLDEALSHAAEEVLFYAASGLQPRSGITLEVLTATPRVLDAANTYQVFNLDRYAWYLESPEDESLLGVDNLPTRGAAWAFLRYLADHDERPDEQLFRALVDSRFAGTENLTRVLGSDAIDLMQRWTVSVYTDDLLEGADPLLGQPSWHFRSILPIFYQNPRFPLAVRTLAPERSERLRLRGGGAAFVRLAAVPGRHAVVTTTSGGADPPDRLRISVVRIR